MPAPRQGVAVELLKAFDANGDGRLDAGEARWAWCPEGSN